MLHAYEIVFKHPRTNEEMKFRAPIPEEFQNYIEKLKDYR